MKWAVVALNRKSMAQALRLKGLCASKGREIELFTLEKYAEEGFFIIEGGLKAFNGHLFVNYEVIVYIMAMGIIVRDIAPWIRHKSLDPAVLCLSVDGNYIIPVLSGHLGGANQRAKEIAGLTGATPVVTTASDLLEKNAVDMMAREKDLVITSYKDAKKLTAMMINGDKVSLYTDTSLKGEISGMPITNIVDEDTRGIIYIGYRIGKRWSMPSVRLMPKNLVIGIGARRHTSYDSIRDFLNSFLANENIDIRAIGKVASIDLKADEKGIVRLAKVLEIPFITYSADILAKEDYRFETSDFVKKTTGAGAVAMPSGYLASNRGTCIIEKAAADGMTLCLWEERL